MWIVEYEEEELNIKVQWNLKLSSSINGLYNFDVCDIKFPIILDEADLYLWAWLIIMTKVFDILKDFYLVFWC